MPLVFGDPLLYCQVLKQRRNCRGHFELLEAEQLAGTMGSRYLTQAVRLL